MVLRFQLNALLLGAFAATHQWTGVVAGAEQGEEQQRRALLRDAHLVKRKLATKSTKAPVPTTAEPAPTKAPKSTKAPTPSPTMYYCSEGHIMSVLETYSDPVDLATVGSSQYLAAQWILEDNICPDAPNFKQRYAYVVGVYAGINPDYIELDFGEGKWIDHLTHECDWSEYGYFCNDNQELDVVDYFLKSFTGTIPTEIGLLTSTTYLDYARNTALHGTIPTELARLTLLKNFDMYTFHGGYSFGTLPGEVLAGWAGSLTSLDLGEGGWTGTIPSELGLCTKLEYLYLHENGLTGPIPTDLAKLTSLKKVEMYYNEGTLGSFPGEVLGGWAGSLTYLDLDGAGLTGTIPTEIGLCINLETLYLSDNDFNDAVPTQLGSLAVLDTLWLYGNSLLTGAVPSDLCDTLTDVQVDCGVTCSCGGACSCS